MFPVTVASIPSALQFYQDGDVDRPRALAALPAILSVGLKWEAVRAKRWPERNCG